MCAYCAGSSRLDGFVDAHLREQWKSLLPVCLECRDAGALPLARTRKRNGAVRARETETARLAKKVRADREAQVQGTKGIASSSGTEANQPAPATQRQVRRRNQRPPTPAHVILTSPPISTHGVLQSYDAPTIGVLASTPAPDYGVMPTTLSPTHSILSALAETFEA